jgi:2-haloacid dehalogenase
MSDLKAILFDVIGTVVDWRGTIKRALVEAKVTCDGDVFAEEWAHYYAEGDFKSEGEIALKGFDLLFDRGFIVQGAMDFAKIDPMTHIWTHLEPWPDVLDGLARLNGHYATYPLSNVTWEMMRRLSKNVGLNWHGILSAQAVGVKKPDSKVYWMAQEKTGRKPHELLMVASHLYDLRAAKAEGFRTAYVQRPGEDGDPTKKDHLDYVVHDFKELADRLGV